MPEKMKAIECPVCRSENIMLNAGGQTGKYECKKYGYIGPLIIEVERYKNMKRNAKDNKTK